MCATVASELNEDLEKFPGLFGFSGLNGGHFGREQTVVGQVPQTRHSDTIE